MTRNMISRIYADGGTVFTIYLCRSRFGFRLEGRSGLISGMTFGKEILFSIHSRDVAALEGT